MKLSIKTRPALEVIFEFSMIFLYIWGIERLRVPWLSRTFFWGVCVFFPFYCIGKDQKTFPEFSLDWKTFLKSFKEVFRFTLIASAGLILIGFHFQSFNFDGFFLTRISEYFFWAFLQQFGLQTFLTTRVKKVLERPYLTALASSSLFALIHMPNPSLVIFSWIGGFFWSLYFQRTPNLYTLILSHGWLAVLTLHCLPSQWIHSLKIGPSFLNS